MDGLLFILENIIFDHTSSFTNILSVIISSFKLLYKMQCSCIIYSRQFCQTVPIISLDVGSFRKKIEHCYCIKLQNYYTNSFQSILLKIHVANDPTFRASISDAEHIESGQTKSVLVA